MTRLLLLLVVGCAGAPHPVPSMPNARPLCGTTLECMPASHVERGVQVDTNLTAPRRDATIG